MNEEIVNAIYETGFKHGQEMLNLLRDFELLKIQNTHLRRRISYLTDSRKELMELIPRSTLVAAFSKGEEL